MVAGEIPGPVVVATLATLLLDTLGRAESGHLATDRLRTDLRALNARAEAEVGDDASAERLCLVDSA